jgi:hypothetical protein
VQSVTGIATVSALGEYSWEKGNVKAVKLLSMKVPVGFLLCCGLSASCGSGGEPPPEPEAAPVAVPAPASVWPSDSLRAAFARDSLAADSSYIGMPFTGAWVGRPETRSTVPYVRQGDVARWEFELFQVADGTVRGLAVLQSQQGTRMLHEVAGIADSNTVVLTLACRCIARGTVKYRGTLEGPDEIRGSYVTPGPGESPVEMILVRQSPGLVAWPVRRPF